MLTSSESNTVAALLARADALTRELDHSQEQSTALYRRVQALERERDAAVTIADQLRVRMSLAVRRTYLLRAELIRTVGHARECSGDAASEQCLCWDEALGC